MFTSHYTAERSFAETREGLFPVITHGDFLPRHLFNALHIVFAILRSIYLAICVSLFYGSFDVFVCDQVCKNKATVTSSKSMH